MRVGVFLKKNTKLPSKEVSLSNKDGVVESQDLVLESISDKIAFDDSISILKEIGPARKFLLNKIGIFKIRHLLLFFPKKFLNITKQISEGEVLIYVTITSKYRQGKLWIVKGVDSAHTEITMLFFNQKSVAMFFKGRQYLVCGKAVYCSIELDKISKSVRKSDNSTNKSIEVSSNEWTMKGVRVLTQLAIEKPTPVYASSISSLVLHKIINTVLSKLPDGEVKTALYNIHNNIDIEKSMLVLKKLEADLFATIFKQDDNNLPIEMSFNDSKLQSYISFIDALPLKFKLNADQMRVIHEIIDQLCKKHCMRHMLFAEVGAGKTVVSLVIAILVMRAGFRVAFLAPTTTLLQQHASWMVPFLEQIGIKSSVVLAGNKKYIDGQFIIGTHALLHAKEKIENLGLVIIDEMQRFGVLQRAQLLSDAVCKNLLMLSATPIPRSLNILLEKFMTFSMIKESVFKKDTQTTIVSDAQIDNIIERIVETGKKTYWVMPSIEENDLSIGVLSRADYIKARIKDKIGIEILHGKMKDAAKLEAINNFRNGEAQILVATTIVEIGIDIPDADLIVIENAGQFGLAQLHQLRGRVGRAGQKSYCILLYQKYYPKKLICLKNYADGFTIAKYDLEYRGGGRIMGLLQHGHENGNPFMFLQLPDDKDILNAAQAAYRADFDLLIEDTQIIH